MLNSSEHEISNAHKTKNYAENYLFIPLKLSDGVFILLVNVKMPTIVVILTFTSRINTLS